jgi:hypothetical protein
VMNGRRARRPTAEASVAVHTVRDVLGPHNCSQTEEDFVYAGQERSIHHLPTSQTAFTRRVFAIEYHCMPQK